MKSKIVLEQSQIIPGRYYVKKLINLLKPDVNSVITRSQVEQLMADNKELTVEIVEKGK